MEEGSAQLPDGTMIKGAIVLNNIRAFEDVVGAEVVQSALDGLEPAVRRELDAVVSAAWVPATTVDVIFAAIANEAGRDLRELFPAAIERGVERTLHTVWRALLRFTSDRAIISRTPKLFSKSYNRGHMTVEFPRPGVAEAELTGWPNTPEFRLLAICAGIRTVLRLAGRKDVQVSFDKTDDGASFTATWIR